MLKEQLTISFENPMQFSTCGPFFVADISDIDESSIRVGKHGMETVKQGQKTGPHSHEFMSLYKSEGLDVMGSDGERIELPEKALVVVPKGVEHSWVPKEGGGAVGSIDPTHEPQVLVEA